MVMALEKASLAFQNVVFSTLQLSRAFPSLSLPSREPDMGGGDLESNGIFALAAKPNQTNPINLRAIARYHTSQSSRSLTRS